MGRREGKCLSCNKFGHYAKECLNGQDTSLDDNNHSKDIKEMVDSSKKARNPRYDESNVVSNKIKKRYLVLALSFRLFGNLAY